MCFCFVSFLSIESVLNQSWEACRERENIKLRVNVSALVMASALNAELLGGLEEQCS